MTHKLGVNLMDWSGQIGKDKLRLLPAIKKMGYDGWVVVESFNSVIAELAGATCVWRPLAESPETLSVRQFRI